MLEFELLNFLFIPNTSTAKGHQLISETSYFSTDVDLLNCYSCPTCNIKGKMFRGFFFIQCRECNNCFLDGSELTDLMIKQYRG
jgi:hypothetical protein